MDILAGCTFLCSAQGDLFFAWLFSDHSQHQLLPSRYRSVRHSLLEVLFAVEVGIRLGWQGLSRPWTWCGPGAGESAVGNLVTMCTMVYARFKRIVNWGCEL